MTLVLIDAEKQQIKNMMQKEMRCLAQELKDAALELGEEDMVNSDTDTCHHEMEIMSN